MKVDFLASSCFLHLVTTFPVHLLQFWLRILLVFSAFLKSMIASVISWLFNWNHAVVMHSQNYSSTIELTRLGWEHNITLTPLLNDIVSQKHWHLQTLLLSWTTAIELWLEINSWRLCHQRRGVYIFYSKSLVEGM